VGLVTENPSFVTVNTVVYAIVCVTIGLKAALAVLCYSVNALRKSSTLEAYAQDHVNDTITNSVGIAGMIVAAR
jgi:divalent metal cation (Fe/Co/Zn/Cd) transporter